MYRLCTSEKSEQQQRMLCSSFQSLLLTEDYDDITISQICQNAGLSRNVFYRLFDKKVDVLHCLLDQALLDCANYTPDPSVKSGEMHRFLAFWREQKPLLDALAKNNGSALLLNRAVQHILQEDTDLVQCFSNEDTGTDREFMVFYITGLFSLVFYWHQLDYSHSIDELSAILMNIMTTPPVKRPSKRFRPCDE